MARATYATRRGGDRSQRTETALVRIVLGAMLLLPIAAYWRISSITFPEVRPTSAQDSSILRSINLRAFLTEDKNSRFLPPPVEAIGPEIGAGPPVPSTGEVAQRGAPEEVKVANTGGAGAILRIEPVRGRQIAALRDGQPLVVLERLAVEDSEWLRIRTREGVEGWIYGRLVAPA